jgi:hypothetical protein
LSSADINLGCFALTKVHCMHVNIFMLHIYWFLIHPFS